VARLIKTEAVVEGRTEVRWTLVEEDSTPEWPADQPPGVVGQPATRLTAAARLSGSARYTSDMLLPRQLEATVLRSPHANARLASISLDAARAVPGVRAVIGPDDCPPFDGETVLHSEPPYAGAAVAAIAADTPEAADEALAALEPRWEPLGFVVDLDQSLENQTFQDDPVEYERGDAESALAAAELTIAGDYLAPAQLHNSMEPHCAVADWRPDGLTLWSSTQGIYQARSQLCGSFGLDQEHVRVICHFMGGGFGSKFGCGPEGIIAAELSRRAGRPVRLVLSRRDENLSTGYRTPVRFSFTIGAGRDGRLQAVEASAVLGLGTGGWAYPALEPVKSVYACEHQHLMTLPMRLNLGPASAFRAPGVMEGTWAFEQALDELAEAAGLDPLELRRRNHTDVDPSTGRPYTSKRLLESYDLAAELAGWDTRHELRSDDRIRRGMGCASQYWWGGGGPPAYADVRIGSDAKPVLTVGMQDLGTGVTTACAVVLAERLGIRPDQVTVRTGDTDLAGHGPFSGGSMTLASVAPAVRSAGHHVRTQLLELAADMFEIAASDLELTEGEVRSTDGTLRRPIHDVTEKLGNAWVTGSGSRAPNPDGMAVNTFGCQIAQVAVDTLTGLITVERVVAVHDIGRVVNPMGARSQVLGGILQGIGFALSEERVVDPTTGTVVNAGFEDYKIPTLADLPEVESRFVGEPDPELALGIKGLGEPPIIPTPGAIGNAVSHALGLRLREAPYTPRRVLEALQ
jgi:CO/xanthine dehydrogenase Mo-binding subunit